MAIASDVQSFSASDASAAIDRDDPSLGEITFFTNEGRYKFQLPRMNLKRLARELQASLQASAEDQPEG